MAGKILKGLFLLFIFYFLLSPSPVFADDNPPLFFDDFNDGNFSGWSIESGNWIVKDGTLESKVTGKVNILGKINTGNKEWDNYRLEMDVNNLNGIDEGIEFRKSGSSAYAFNLRHGTGVFNTPEIKFFKKINGVDFLLSSTHEQQLLNNSWYHIKIEVLDENIKLWVNDKKVMDYSDPGTQIKKGSIGLDSWTGSFRSIDVRFDNIKVTAIPQPFLDLPWDYEDKELDFDEASLAMTSYFDHSYPLLSSGIHEFVDGINQVTTYEGENSTTKNYSSHDGYDYGKIAKVNISDPVLAAAPGYATYVNACKACGNMVIIDHQNGYQTRYLHLQKNGLISNEPGKKIWVDGGQKIGKVGATGNVSPAGDAGAHIHFDVYRDKNGDGNFEDNIPDGATDPFGWQSKDPDPWPNYNFLLGGASKTGSKSYYLWRKKLSSLDSALSSNKAAFNIGRFTFDFPQGSTDKNLNLNFRLGANTKASDSLVSLGSTIVATAADLTGQLITEFSLPFIMSADFSKSDLTRFKPDSLSFYFSQDGKTWTKTPTTINWDTKIATAPISHFTHFALMAERKDTTPPSTDAFFTGAKGQEGWFRSDVTVNLNAKDNEDGLGVDYTVYRINGGEWEIYGDSLDFTGEGHYKIDFYSADNDENLEAIKSVEFNIDKTIPEAKIFIDPGIPDLVVEGIDKNPTTVYKIGNTSIITDTAGNNLEFETKGFDKEKKDKLSMLSLSYNNNTPILLDENALEISYIDKKNIHTIKEEKFRIKDEIKLKIKYDFLTDQSTVFIKEQQQEKIKEIRDGLTLLQLKTNRGNLEYSY